MNTHPKTPCCNYTCTTDIPYPVMWNPYNKEIQCHNCGEIYVASHKSCSKQYLELLYAVERKFENESRHQTALRYINEAEKRANNEPPQTTSP